MAFVNEVLTPEQREEVNSWKIKRPVFYCGRIVSEADIISPFEWTIDKERNMYLLHASVDLSNL